MRTKKTATIIHRGYCFDGSTAEALLIPAGLPVQKRPDGDYEVFRLEDIANVPSELIEASYDAEIILRPDQVEPGYPLPGKVRKSGWVILGVWILSVFFPLFIPAAALISWLLFRRINKQLLEQWGPPDDKDDDPN